MQEKSFKELSVGDKIYSSRVSTINPSNQTKLITEEYTFLRLVEIPRIRGRCLIECQCQMDDEYQTIQFAVDTDDMDSPTLKLASKNRFLSTISHKRCNKMILEGFLIPWYTQRLDYVKDMLMKYKSEEIKLWKDITQLSKTIGDTDGERTTEDTETSEA